MKTGVVDVGGGLRDIYGSGVFDYLLEKNIHFDVCFGVSAGSANISSYLSGQAGKIRESLHNMLKGQGAVRAEIRRILA